MSIPGKLAELAIKARADAPEQPEGGKNADSGISGAAWQTDRLQQDLANNRVFLVGEIRLAAALKITQRKTRRCLPLRSKVLNTWKWTATGCLPTPKSTLQSPSASTAWTERRAGPERPALRQVCICRTPTWTRLAHPGAAADAVFRHFPKLGEPCVWRATPLYRVDAPARVKPASRFMRWTGELTAILDKLPRTVPKTPGASATSKGLGRNEAPSSSGTRISRHAAPADAAGGSGFLADRNLIRTKLMGKGGSHCCASRIDGTAWNAVDDI
jgi:hypothetical protein